MDEKEENNENRIQFFIPCWSGINVIVEIPRQYGGLNPDTNLTQEMLLEYMQHPPQTSDINPFAYFKIRDEEGNPITSFVDNPLKLQVRYTSTAWAASSKARGGQPRIYFRSYIGGVWAADWVEIPVAPQDVKPPDSKNPYGTLTAYLTELPDPAIGGC